MKRRNLFFICGLILFCGTIGSKITASAQDTVWNSQGLIVFDNHTEEKNDDVVKVPLLGKITAGNPSEAIENPNEYFPIPAQLIPQNSEVFTLRVSGESMINAGILDGDIVIVQKQNIARNGDIVVAMTMENEVTLKTFYKEKE